MSDIYSTDTALDSLVEKLEKSNYSDSEKVLLKEFRFELHAENLSDRRIMRDRKSVV